MDKSTGGGDEFNRKHHQKAFFYSEKIADHTDGSVDEATVLIQVPCETDEHSWNGMRRLIL